VPDADGVKEISQDATPIVPIAASAQLPELPNDPVVGEDVKLTDPDGVVAPLDAVSVTVTVHDVVLPTTTESHWRPKLVDVGSTAGAGELAVTELAVTELDWPLLVLWVLSPW
jgi:hypothetical protein